MHCLYLVPEREWLLLAEIKLFRVVVNNLRLREATSLAIYPCFSKQAIYKLVTFLWEVRILYLSTCPC